MKVVVWLSLAVILLGLVFSLATCRSEETLGRVVTIFDWPFAINIKLDRERIKVFEADNPDIKMLLVTGQEDKYITMVTAGVAPDVATTGYGYIPYYAKCGMIRPLNDLIEADEKKRKAILALDKITDAAERQKAILALDNSIAAATARRNALSALNKSVAAGGQFSCAKYFDSDKAEILALDKITDVNDRRRAIFEMDESVAADTAKRRAIAAMNKAAGAGGKFSCAEYFDAMGYYSRDDYFPATLESVTYEGKIYALPDTGSPVAIIYNKDMFRKYNKDNPDKKLDFPNEKWTWDDYRKAAEALTQHRDDRKRLVYGASMGFHRNRFPMFVWQAGGEVINKEKTKCLMDSPEAIRAMQFMYDILWKYKCAPTAQTQMEGLAEQGEGDRFCKQRIAMLLTARYSYSKLLKDGKWLTKFEWDVAQPPMCPETGKRTSIYIGGGWMISARIRNLDEAWRVAKFLVGSKSCEMAMEAGRALTSHKAVAAKMTRGPNHKPEHDYLWSDIMSDCRPKDFEYRTGAAGPMFDKAMGELYELPYDRRKPKEACINCTKYFNKALRILREKDEKDRKEAEARKNK